MEKEKYISKEDYKKEIIKMLSHLGYKHGVFKVFEDLICMMACSISNTMDAVHYEERENTYVKLMSYYSPEERKQFDDLSNLIIAALDLTKYSADLLGEIYHELHLHNEHNDNYFTSINISHLMPDIVIFDKDIIKKRGYISTRVYSCGSGATLIGTANSLYRKKFNPNFNMCCLAVDNDFICVLMTYIQLSLLGIPAVVIHGDSLARKEYARFYTPMYILGGWVWKEKWSITDGFSIDDEKLKCVIEPVYFLMKYGLNRDKKEDKSEV